jgi:hypothetical protein
MKLKQDRTSPNKRLAEIATAHWNFGLSFSAALARADEFQFDIRLFICTLVFQSAAARARPATNTVNIGNACLLVSAQRTIIKGG